MSTRVSAWTASSREARRPRRRASSGASSSAAARAVERLVELPRRDGLGAPVVGERRARLRAASSERVLDPGEPLADRAAGASISSRQALPSAIRWPARLPLSTVETYRGSSGRRSPRVVPVVEVAAEALERVACVASVASSRSTVSSDADPAEVAGGDRREQVEPDVRRRRAMRDDRLRILLEVVGRQDVVLRPDEGLEEAPGAARDRAQEPARPRRRAARRRRRRGGRLTQRATSGESTHSEHERRRDQPAPPAATSATSAAAAAASTTAPRHAPVDAGRRRGPSPPSPAPRSTHSSRRRRVTSRRHERARDRVGHQPGLVGEEGDAERDLRSRRARGPRRRARRWLRFEIPRRRGTSSASDGQRARGARASARTNAGPHQRRRRRQRPAGDEREPGGRRRQRAAQVVEHLPARRSSGMPRAAPRRR